MIRIIIQLLLFAVIIYVTFLILGMIPLPPVVRIIAVLILGIVFLVRLLKKSGVPIDDI